MSVEYLNWDSKFFNLKVGEINDNNLVDFDQISDYNVFYLKQKERKPIQIENFEKTFEETKVVFSKQILSWENNDFSQDVLDFDSYPLENSLFYELAFVSGAHSRFLLDKKFGLENFRKLYRIWVDNSINKKFADKIFYTLTDEKISGFVTIKLEKDIAKIGLIAVHPKYQGNGLGRKLISVCENFCFENKIHQLEIPTQEENAEACIFYTKCAYSIKNKMIIQHYWKLE